MKKLLFKKMIFSNGFYFPLDFGAFRNNSINPELAYRRYTLDSVPFYRDLYDLLSSHFRYSGYARVRRRDVERWDAETLKCWYVGTLERWTLGDHRTLHYTPLYIELECVLLYLSCILVRSFFFFVFN